MNLLLFQFEFNQKEIFNKTKEWISSNFNNLKEMESLILENNEDLFIWSCNKDNKKYNERIFNKEQKEQKEKDQKEKDQKEKDQKKKNKKKKKRKRKKEKKNKR
ncbi:hypothetical protein M0811_05567 [Anaeramoeba ignava]|uniref:Uncharacterized protein n=1 Tax=Anaeramoeba ignava TaxID=1746090 RepID=A0A9Q0RF58_ANAIG|nr:hypothetical protein M0811_05567 [Anaeramoeba ignava]